MTTFDNYIYSKIGSHIDIHDDHIFTKYLYSSKNIYKALLEYNETQMRYKLYHLYGKSLSITVHPTEYKDRLDIETMLDVACESNDRIFITWFSEQLSGDFKLHRMLSFKDLNMLKLILQNFNFTSCDKLVLAMNQACEIESLGILKWLDQNYKITHDKICYTDCYPNSCHEPWCLVTTAKTGNLEIFSWLMDKYVFGLGCPTNFVFRMAANYGHLHIIKYLENRFGPLCYKNTEDDDDYHPRYSSYGRNMSPYRSSDVLRGRCAFKLAYINGHIEVLDWLIDYFDMEYVEGENEWTTSGASIYLENLRMEDNMGSSTLHTLEFLIDKLKIPTIKNEFNQIYLTAAQYGYLDVMKWIDKQYEMTREDLMKHFSPGIYGSTPPCYKYGHSLAEAVSNSHTEVVRYLIEHHGMNDLVDSKLICFSVWGDLDLTRYLILKCKDEVSNLYSNLCHCTFSRDRVEILEWLYQEYNLSYEDLHIEDVIVVYVYDRISSIPMKCFDFLMNKYSKIKDVFLTRIGSKEYAYIRNIYQLIENRRFYKNVDDLKWIIDRFDVSYDQFVTCWSSKYQYEGNDGLYDNVRTYEDRKNLRDLNEWLSQKYQKPVSEFTYYP